MKHIITVTNSKINTTDIEQSLVGESENKIPSVKAVTEELEVIRNSINIGGHYRGDFTNNTQYYKNDWIILNSVKQSAIKDFKTFRGYDPLDWRTIDTPLSGVGLFISGVPSGFFLNLTDANKFTETYPQPTTENDYVFKVYGSVGDALGVQFVTKSCTIELTPGSILTTKEFPLFYGAEREDKSRIIKLTGDGTLVGNISAFGFAIPINLECYNIKWIGKLVINTIKSGVRDNFLFRNCKHIVPADSIGIEIAYKHGGFYDKPFFIWYDKCSVSFNKALVFPHAVSGDKSNNYPNVSGEVNSNLIRFTNNVFDAPSTAKLWDLSIGSTHLEYASNVYINGIGLPTEASESNIKVDQISVAASPLIVRQDLATNSTTDIPSIKAVSDAVKIINDTVLVVNSKIPIPGLGLKATNNIWSLNPTTQSVSLPPGELHTYLNENTGEVIPIISEYNVFYNYVTSPLIAIDATNTLTISPYTSIGSWYDANGKFISGGSGGKQGAPGRTNIPAEMPVGAAFIRLCYPLADYTKVQYGQGNLPYVRYVNNMKPDANGGIFLNFSPGDKYGVLPYKEVINLDFALENIQQLILTGNVTFAASSNLGLQKNKQIFITNTTSTSVTLVFPAAWNFLSTIPTVLASGKKAVLTLEIPFGITESDIYAEYSVQS